MKKVVDNHELCAIMLAMHQVFEQHPRLGRTRRLSLPVAVAISTVAGAALSPARRMTGSPNLAAYGHRKKVSRLFATMETPLAQLLSDSEDLRRQAYATIFNLGYLILVASGGIGHGNYPCSLKDWHPVRRPGFENQTAMVVAGMYRRSATWRREVSTMRARRVAVAPTNFEEAADGPA